jgi:tRNA(fMet)-specific endonuclease VapC
LALTRLLVDTSAYSLAMRGRTDAIKALRAADTLGLSPVMLGELLSGFKRGNREQTNRQQLAEFVGSPRVQRLQISDATSEHYAELLANLTIKGKKIPTNDAWIAASALEYRMTLLTADHHFLLCSPLRVELLA